LVGRPPDSRTGELSLKTISALTSLWIAPEDPLSFTQIHKGLVKKGVVKKLENKMTTARILKRAIKMGILQKKDRKYYLNVPPKKFIVFDYLQRIADTAETTEFHAGCWLWRLCQLYCVGMPSSILKHEDLKFILDILLLRVSWLYEALKDLAEEAEKREKNPSYVGMPMYALREATLELIPYFLGSFAGCDFDGLSLEDLHKLIPLLIQALPEEVDPQSPTRKDLMKKYFEILEYLKYKALEQEEEEIEESFFKKPKDFGLVIIPPEYLIAEDEAEKRAIKEDLEEFAHKSPLYIASSLLTYKKENVETIISIYGASLFKKSKLNKIMELYEKIYASNWVARIIGSYQFYDDKEKKQAKKIVNELAAKHGWKSLIMYLPFSRSRHCWFLPNEKKLQLLSEFFPVAKETIEEWLYEGIKMKEPIDKDKFEQLKRTFKGFKE